MFQKVENPEPQKSQDGAKVEIIGAKPWTLDCISSLKLYSCVHSRARLARMPTRSKLFQVVTPQQTIDIYFVLLFLLLYSLWLWCKRGSQRRTGFFHILLAWSLSYIKRDFEYNGLCWQIIEYHKYTKDCAAWLNGDKYTKMEELEWEGLKIFRN